MNSQEHGGASSLTSFRDRTSGLSPSRELLARLDRIPDARLGWAAFASAVANFAFPSVALAAAASLVFAFATPNDDSQFDDEAAQAIALEIEP